MANELYLQRRIIDIVEEEGGYGVKTHAPMAGIPDLLLSHPEYGPALAEIKLGSDNSTKLQQATQRRMRAAGFHVVVLVLLLEGNRTYVYANDGEALINHGRLGWDAVRSAIWGDNGGGYLSPGEDLHQVPSNQASERVSEDPEPMPSLSEQSQSADAKPTKDPQAGRQETRPVH